MMLSIWPPSKTARPILDEGTTQPATDASRYLAGPRYLAAPRDLICQILNIMKSALRSRQRFAESAVPERLRSPCDELASD